MEFRKAKASELNCIMEIIESARAFLKSQKIDQWQNDYPNSETILSDMEKGIGYVALDEEEVLAYVAIDTAGEPTYAQIEGAWKTDEAYGVVHRMAIGSENRGLGLSRILMLYAEECCLKQGIDHMRIDTHAQNQIMQRLIKKVGYEYCGIIHVSDGTPRYAYEKEIKA